jgi:predicted transcriptional regulator
MKRGFVTKKTQPFYNGFGYYLMVWHLRDNGIVAADGYEDTEKVWKLTDKGREVAGLFAKLEELNKKIEAFK